MRTRCNAGHSRGLRRTPTRRPPGSSAVASATVLPIVGGLYRIDTILLSAYDPKPKRPAVVLAMPAYGTTDVRVLTRTSDTTQRGVQHPKSRSLGLTKDGVFAYKFLRSLDQKCFSDTTRVVYLGMLEPVYFQKVQAWWEER